jgi:hypothetical protein
MECLQHVELGRSAAGEDGASDPDHHREQDERGQLVV